MYNKEVNTKVDSIVPIEVEKILRKNASRNKRTKSQEICYILTKYFAHELEELEKAKKGNA